MVSLPFKKLPFSLECSIFILDSQEVFLFTIYTKFYAPSKQYTEINELTAELLHLFIERVEVGERTEKWSRTAMQEINIYYRDIGLLDNIIEQPAEQEIPQSTEVA